MTMMRSTAEAGLDRLHEAMAARVAKGELPGMVTLVAQGEGVHVDPIGVMAFDSAEPMRRDTIFRITSMTKPILAAATMMLVDDGKLALDEPVDRLLPELADRRVLRRVDGPLDDTVPARRPITVLDLVMGPPDPRTPHDPDGWIKRFGTLPLMYQPGERWQYNTGSLVLGVLVARASRQPLAEFFRTRIFEPLGMKDTGFVVPENKNDRLPSQYQTNFQTGKMELQTLTGPSVWNKPPAFPSGAAGLVSTIDDYLAFARLLESEGVHGGKRLLSQRSVELMTTNRLSPEQMATGGPLLGGQGWGFGMAVATVTDEVSAEPGRYGWSGGYGTFWFNDPHRRLVAIAMTQTSDVLFNGTMIEFAKLAVHS
ncbi:MAG: beta-lactamase family protein [Chloroflexi bacterium]|nr:MAG: beta-lactamase family protein [Chloroflexota bacterium]